MTTSPYDNLPVGSQMSTATPQEEQLRYVDVNLEAAEEPSADSIPGSAMNHKSAPIEPARPDAIQVSRILSPPPQSKQHQQVTPSPQHQQHEQPEQPAQPPQSQHTEQPERLAQPARPEQISLAPAQNTVPAPPAQNTVPAPPAYAKITPFEKAPKYDKCSIQNIWKEQEYILPFEESLLVPDTMPDMEQVLFAEGRVDLMQPGKIQYEKDDFVSGDITVYTVYKPVSDSDSPVDVVKSSIPFKTDKCWDKTEGDHFRVTVSVKNISIEMINERKFIAKGQLLIAFTEIIQKELMVFNGVDDPALVQSDGSICVTGLDFEMNETTEISQEINCREEQPAPVKILKDSIYIVENHRQITSGKLVINASIHSQILYLGEKDGEQKLSCLTNKTDFAQFVTVNDKTDVDLMKISFGGNELKINIENQNQFLLQGQVTTLIQGYKNQDIPIVSDAYHKLHDIKFDVEAQPLSAVKDTVSGEISAREVIDLGEATTKPEVLLCGSSYIASIEGRRERDRVVIEGSMPVKILALDDENMPFLIENTIPLRGSLEMPAANRDATLSISSSLKEFWFDEINSRQMEINASISLNIWATGRETFKTLENLCFVEQKHPARRIPMALYVVSPGDTLWDVAKKYKSDMNMLAELNQIDPQKPLPEGMKLFVAK